MHSLDPRNTGLKYFLLKIFSVLEFQLFDAWTDVSYCRVMSFCEMYANALADENITLITDCEEPRPYEGPEPGSRWIVVFDGASNALGNGIGVVIISPQGCHTPFTVRLWFDCTNNMAE